MTLAIYGSVARKTQGYYSDLDILIIAERLPYGRMNRVKEFDEVEGKIHPFIQKMQNEGIYTGLSPVFKTPDEAVAGSPLFLDMVEDVEIHYDRDKFFEQRLDVL